MRQDVAELVDEAREELVALRRELHADPELSFEETRTADRIGSTLRELGLEVRQAVGRTGVLGRLRGRGRGPVVALRADIDALPIQEESSAAYASRNPGVMHACGHDGHVAILLTVAKVLTRLRERFDGEVLFVFQPAEEIASGAPAMLEDGAFDDPRPDAVFGLHLWNNLDVGLVGVRAGPLFANTDELGIVIRGFGGHGAMPHLSVDPIVVSAQVVTALQTMVSRETSPLEPAVVSITSFRGGSSWNIIPPEVRLRGTVRTFTDQLQEQMRERIEAVVRGVTAGMRAEYELTYRKACPAVVNDAALTELARAVARREFGDDQVVLPEQTMGGDDMSYFLQRAPGVYYLVGTRNRARGFDAPHHHPRFDIDEAALPIGARLLAASALERLEGGRD
jgi:amidohydrolase